MEQTILHEIRLNTSEEMSKFNKDVRKVGKLLKSIVRFFVAFFFFLVFNLCLDLFTKHTHLISLENFRFLEEGLRVFINQNVVAFASVLSEHNMLATAIITFACVFDSFVIVYAFTAIPTDTESEGQAKEHKQFKQECVSASSVVSYKQKVCFLS